MIIWLIGWLIDWLSILDCIKRFIDWFLMLSSGSPSDQQMELIPVHRPSPLGAVRQGLEQGDGDVTWQGNQLFHPPPQQLIIAGMVVIIIIIRVFNLWPFYCYIPADHIAVLTVHFLVLDVHFLVLDIHFIVLDAHFLVLDIYFIVLDILFSVLDAHFLVLDILFTVLAKCQVFMLDSLP